MRADDGFAMVAVMGVVALVTVVAVAGFVVAQNVLNESSRVLGESRAFQVAQSGLDRELAGFDKGLVDATGSYTKTGTTADGSYTIVARRLSGYEYIMTSTGTADGETEEVSQRFFWLSLWDMNIGAGENASLGGGNGWNGTASIDGPMYIRGDFDWTANATYERGPLFIKDGALNNWGSGTIGLKAPIDLFVTEGIFGKTQNVYTKSVSSSVPDIQLPWLDEDYMAERLAWARAESVDNQMGAFEGVVNSECIGGNPATYLTMPLDGGATRIMAPATPASTSNEYKYIGGGSMGGLGSGAYNLTINSTSFGAWEGNGYPAASGLHDDFAYDAANGILYVEGTVFIDGDLTIGENVRTYKGNGTLVVNGDVQIDGDLIPEGKALSAQNALGIACPNDVTFGSNGDTAHMWGAIFSNGTVGFYGSATSVNPTSFRGSLICGNIYGDQPNIAIQTDPILPSVIPGGMPAVSGGIRFDGLWSRN